MDSIKNKPSYALLFVLLTVVGLITAGCIPRTSQVSKTAGPTTPAEQKAPPCAGPGCPDLIITQAGRPARFSLSAQGIQAAAPFAQPQEETQTGRWVIDTGTPSPDGKWVAYTTIGYETGGPVLLHNVSTGRWTNLIDAINTHLPGGQPAYPLEAWWDVIGWFPDSARMMIGPSDLSQVLIVDLPGFTFRQITFPGGGRGGRLFASLAPDGSSFTYIGEDAAGSQVFNQVDLTSGQTTTLLKLPYAKGVLYNPRISPDHQQIAYLLQKGSPEQGLTYSLSLLSPETQQVRVLADGNLGLTVPVWSPDGRYIAFARNDGSQPQRVLPETLPSPQASSIWVVSVADGKAAQITFLECQARSPAWAKDSQTLAFVMEDGQVRVTSLAQPGTTWQAAGPTSDPMLTSAFFLP